MYGLYICWKLIVLTILWRLLTTMFGWRRSTNDNVNHDREYHHPLDAHPSEYTTTEMCIANGGDGTRSTDERGAFLRGVVGEFNPISKYICVFKYRKYVTWIYNVLHKRISNI